MCSQISVALNNFDSLIVNVEVRLGTFLGAFVKDQNFVFLGLILSIHEVQWDDNILRDFCNPALDLDNITNSSASTSEFTYVPLVTETKGSDKGLSKEYGI